MANSSRGSSGVIDLRVRKGKVSRKDAKSAKNNKSAPRTAHDIIRCFSFFALFASWRELSFLYANINRRIVTMPGAPDQAKQVALWTRSPLPDLRRDRFREDDVPDAVIPAKAGIQHLRASDVPWIPAFAGMTVVGGG
jgi:hypothetical protein